MRKYFISFIVCLLLTGCERAPEQDTFDLNAALGGTAEAGFARALKPREFSFPADHAAHPEFRNEWWYVTGNVKTGDGRHFGYQVTFFRIALSPQAVPVASVWSSRQVWMAHVALTDVEQGEHWHGERLARGAAGMAGQTTEPFRVWLEDWQLVGTRAGEFPWAVAVQTDDFRLNLQLLPEKPPVLQGDQGLSQKSSAAGNASYYYSLTRLRTVGEIYQGGQRYVVNGYSWLDREWSTSVLGDDQAGWDWFSLQLADGNDVMFYRLRKHSGAMDKYSAGKWVLADGSSEVLEAGDVELEPVRYWQSGRGRRYPVQWRMQFFDKDWEVEALLDDQLMRTGVTYWEGAVRVTDRRSGGKLGYGYLEMSGY